MMTKKRLKKEDIFEAAFSLEKSGAKPTANNIRDHIGSGSLTTITKYLKEWSSQKGTLIEENFPNMSDVLNEVENDVLKEFFMNELPQVTALVFSYLPVARVVEILKGYDEKAKEEILSKIESIGYVQSQILGTIASMLASELRSISLSKGEQVGGAKFAASIRKEMAS